jgi:putative membrane protein
MFGGKLQKRPNYQPWWAQGQFTKLGSNVTLWFGKLGKFYPHCEHLLMFWLMPWLKALHVIAVVCWFAGLFYLPRLFVYHAQTDDIMGRERFKIMERKLYRGIMWPSLILTVLFGGWMLGLSWDVYRTQGWLHAKLGLVVLLIVYHLFCGHYLNAFQENRNVKSHVFFRIFNELPVLALIAIVILVIVKPF